MIITDQAFAAELEERRKRIRDILNRPVTEEDPRDRVTRMWSDFDRIIAICYGGF
jgi:hypothetical protein